MSGAACDQGHCSITPFLETDSPNQRLLPSSQLLHILCSVLSDSQMGRGVGACAQAPCRTPASYSPRATGDLGHSLPARETNQPQDPGCLRANSKARIICLAHMPVGSTDLRTPAGSFLRHTATKTVAGSQRTWQRTVTCTKQQAGRWESVPVDGSPCGGGSVEHDGRTKKPAQNLRSARLPIHHALVFAKIWRN